MRDREQLSALIKEFRPLGDGGAPSAPAPPGPLPQSLIGGDLRRILDRLPAALSGPGVVDGLRDAASVARLRADAAGRRPRLEIGSARGRFCTAMAARHPGDPFLAAEVRGVHCRRLQRLRERRGLTNLFVMLGDVRLHLPALSAAGPLFWEVYVLCPDPWWKKRHVKRRLFQPGFLEQLAPAVHEGGTLLLRTDVEAYRDMVAELAAGCPLFAPTTPTEQPHLADLPPSRREAELAAAGLPTYTFTLRRTGVAPPPLPEPAP